MKKLIALICLITLTVMSNCKKDNSDNSTPSGTFDYKPITTDLFEAILTAFQTADSSSIKGSALINMSGENKSVNPKGGYIHVLVTISGTMTYNDVTGLITYLYESLQGTGVIHDYIDYDNGEKYTINGSPDISITGIFTGYDKSDFTIYWSPSTHITISGGFQIVGTNYNKTVMIQLTCNINSSGTGGHITGKIGDEIIDMSY